MGIFTAHTENGKKVLTMDEYIDRGIAIAKLTTLEVTDRNATMTSAKRLLAYMPAADVAPVVRCKDCKHYLIADEFDVGKRYMCEVNHFSYINSDGDMRYCSYGERKDDKHEH